MEKDIAINFRILAVTFFVSFILLLTYNVWRLFKVISSDNISSNEHIENQVSNTNISDINIDLSGANANGDIIVNIGGQ